MNINNVTAMSYDEALSKKQSLPSDVIEKGGFTLKVFVTPKDAKGFTEYRLSIRHHFKNLKDEEAILYADEKGFMLRGLWFDGANIGSKDL